jgi:hypothetical protein
VTYPAPPPDAVYALHTAEWDGDAPTPGDYVRLTYRVVGVATGPAPGLYRLAVTVPTGPIDVDARIVDVRLPTG